MEWKIIPIEKKEEPMVTVATGELLFNAAACALIHDDGTYCYAQFFSAKDSWRNVIGVKFLTKMEENSLPIVRLSKDGNSEPGMIIYDNGMISSRFMKEKLNEMEESVRFSVEKIDDTMLKISD